mmetsp:Transcript_26965/g.39915  ORF Transcript_26965/g.39915 Transcript_26965/m.39915 type:complete len:214 (-) Transcript_26965:452-1093(-)
MTRIILLHERNNKANRLQKRRQALPGMLQRSLPQGANDRIKTLNPIGVRRLRQRRQGQSGDGTNFTMLLGQTMTHDLDQFTQVRQHGASHQHGDLLHDFDPGMPCLPAFTGLTHRLQKGEEGWHTQRTRHHGKRARGGVANVFLLVIDIGSHGGDHGGEAGCLGQIRYNFSSFHASVVILVDEEGFDDSEYFVDVGSYQIVEFVQHPIDDLHE